TGTTVTFDGKIIGGNKSLSITGDAIFGDAVGDSVTGLSTLLVSGITKINTDAISSALTQEYKGDVTLGNHTNFTRSKITFDGKVIGRDHSLTITGNAVFRDAAADSVTGVSTLLITGTTQ